MKDEGEVIGEKGGVVFVHEMAYNKKSLFRERI